VAKVDGTKTDDTAAETTNPTMDLPLFCYRVYMFIIQRCIHDPITPMGVDGDAYAVDPWKHDVAEGLVMTLASHETQNIFKRIGVFTAYSGDDLAKLLTEHGKAESRVITLI
jgi:hypothetical protein